MPKGLLPGDVVWVPDPNNPGMLRPIQSSAYRAIGSQYPQSNFSRKTNRLTPEDVNNLRRAMALELLKMRQGQ